MYFSIKNILKNNRNNTSKQMLITLSPKQNKNSCIIFKEKEVLIDL